LVDISVLRLATVMSH